MSFDTRVLEIRSLLQKSKKPLMFFDSDTDGTTSYLQLKRIFPNLVGFSFGRDQNKQADNMRYIEEDHDLIFFIDIAVLKPELLELIKDRTIVWADHHILQDKSVIETYNITYLNPLDYDSKDNRPSCFLAYCIAGSEQNLDLVSVGSIADFFLLDVLKYWNEKSPNQFDSVMRLSVDKKNKLLKFLSTYSFNDSNVQEERENWIRDLTYECGISEIKNFFDFLYKLDNEARMFQALRMIEKISLIELLGEIHSGKGFLFQDYAKLTAKYNKILSKVLEETKDERIIFFQYTGLRAYTKTLAEELCYKLKNWEVIAIFFKKKSGDEWQGSTRSKSVHLPNLLKECLIGLEGYGGGHARASGCKVKDKDMEEFKKRFLDKLSV